jgi:hypothetical protein
MYEERDSSRFWNGTMVFWAFPKQNSTLNREKLSKNWQTGVRNWFLEKVPHNSDYCFIMDNTTITATSP